METREILRSLAAGCLLAIAAGAAVPTASAQALDGQVGRFYDESGWTLYRLGFRQSAGGPLGLALHGSYLTREGDGEGAFAGIGADLTAFRGGSEGPYLVAGIGGGVGSRHTRNMSSFWGSWSAGAGYELFPASFLAFAAEARWRELSLDHRDGWELAAGLSFRFRGAAPRSRPASSPATRTLPPAVRNPVLLRDSVVATAATAMGRPYLYGGTGGDGTGFDCSGLIQYAYGRHGVQLPRTSAQQATEGRKLPRRLDELAPGDLLTFSNRGGPVTHVGLYLGDGRFIHSASRGVQVSVLDEQDPYGRWWYQRWVGARRILEGR